MTTVSIPNSPTTRAKDFRGSELDKLRTITLKNFRYFCMVFMDPAWYDDNFHGKLCDFLQFGKHATAGPEGNSLDKLIVAPRTHGKTTTIEHWACWKATRRPSYERIFVVSNSKSNAIKTISEIKGIIERHPRYQQLYPDRIPDFSKCWASDRASLRRKYDFADATFEAFGVGSNIIRGHCTGLIEDDTVAPKGAELKGMEIMPSRGEMEVGIGFHRLARPLLIDQMRDWRVFIGTRWAFYDVIQTILDNETGAGKGRAYQILDIPAINPETGLPNYKRFSLDALESIKASMGTFMFNALYLNNPMNSAQMRIRPEWIRYYTESELPDDGQTVVTVDPADPPSGRDDQCYSAAVSCQHSKKGLFVRRYRRGRYTDVEIINHTFNIADIDDASLIRIEADRYPHLESAFRLEMRRRNKNYIIEPVKTRGRSKDSRIMRLAATAENGLLFLKSGMAELETEMYQYPLGATVDIIDALAWNVDEYMKLPDIGVAEKAPEPADYRSFSYDQLIEKLNEGRRNKKRIFTF